MPSSARVGDVPRPGHAATRRVDWTLPACVAILVAGTVAAYSRTFSVPLIYDDRFSVAENLSIRHLWPVWPVLSPPSASVVAGRPLLNLSFAVNYALGGTAVGGYHLANLLIHILAGVTLFGIVRRTLVRPILAGRFSQVSTPLALAVSSIWAWHPVQTVSVTYISERAESLMGLLYLLTLYFYIRGADSKGKAGRLAWCGLSILACAAGVATKEVMATAPVMTLLYDRTFISGRFREAWRRNRPVYIGLAATLLLLEPRIAGLLRGKVLFGVGFGGGVPWWDYGLTECRVIMRYILLAFWPNPLVFDYGPTVRCHILEVWPFVLLLGSLLAATLVAVRRSPAVGFVACWFLLILAPTSSIIPLIGQSMAENRLYLSLAGVAVFFAVGAFSLLGRRSFPLLTIVAVGLGMASFRRNEAYQNERAIWSDTVAKNPGNSRAHYNLGYYWLYVPGHMGDAVAELQESIRIKPDNPDAHYNLGYAWLNVPGHTADAIAEFKETLRLTPGNPDAHYNLGYAWLSVPGHLGDAAAQFEEALRLRPAFASAQYNLGNALWGIPDRQKDAVEHFAMAVRLDPGFVSARMKLAQAYLRMPGRNADAKAQLEAVLRLQPGNEAAKSMLNAALVSPR